MKRAFLIIFASLFVAYALAYFTLPDRRPTPLRNAGKFAHIRHFPYDWQVNVFYPAGLVEWALIRANPKPFLPNPTWSAVPQVIILEGRTHNLTIPPRALKQRT